MMSTICISETTKTQQKYGEVVETSKVTLLPDSEPTTQCEEAVISFEDAKSEVPSASKRHVPRYDIEQLIEAELKDISKYRLRKHNWKLAIEDLSGRTCQVTLLKIEISYG